MWGQILLSPNGIVHSGHLPIKVTRTLQISPSLFLHQTMTQELLFLKKRLNCSPRHFWRISPRVHQQTKSCQLSLIGHGIKIKQVHKTPQYLNTNEASKFDEISALLLENCIPTPIPTNFSQLPYHSGHFPCSWRSYYPPNALPFAISRVLERILNSLKYLYNTKS